VSNNQWLTLQINSNANSAALHLHRLFATLARLSLAHISRRIKKY
jgi:hypothetical protein